MRRKPARWIGWSIVAVVIAAALWSFRAQPLSVETAQVVRGPLLVTVDEEGRTRVRDRFTVSAPVAGQLMRIAYRAGARVRAGDTLARIAPAMSLPLDLRSRTQLEARLESARDALTEARARRATAEVVRDDAAKALTRDRDLAREQYLSVRELEMSETRHRQAQSEVEQAAAAVRVAEHEVEAAGAALLASRSDPAPARIVGVRAPCDGAVLRVYEESERVVASGTPLLEIGSPSSLELVVDLLSTDAVRIAPGARALIERWGGDGVLEAQVRLIEPSSFTKVSALGVEEQRVNVILDFTGARETWERLGDGYAVDVRVVIWEHADALKVPTGALFRRGSDWFVFAVAGNRAREQRVSIGPQSGLEAEVKEGLTEGDLVIVHPSDAVADGVRVRPR